MAEFTMPILGADMLAATLVEWKKKPGDPVKRGEILAEVETDKGLIEVENFTDGLLEMSRIGHRHLDATDARHGSVEVVERALHDAGADLG